MDFKCQNGDEEWVFDQVSEAGREQTHCHTYQRLDCFHGYKKVTGIKSKKNSSSEKIPDVRSYSGKKGWVWIDWLDVKEAIFCILKCGSSYRKPWSTPPTGRMTIWCVWKSLVHQDQLAEGKIRPSSFRQPLWSLNTDGSVQRLLSVQRFHT